MYIIKVFKVKSLKGEYPLRTWDLEYVTNLPYLFPNKPINICEQLNIMFKDDFEHVIDVQ